MPYNPNACDVCDDGIYTEENPRVFCCTRRPSDKSEMVCTFAGHKECVAPNDVMPAICDDASSGVATGAQWQEWIETPKAAHAGVLFLTL